MPAWVTICYCVVLVLCIFGTVKLYGAGKTPYAKASLSTLILYTIIFLLIWIFNIGVPSYTIILSMITVLGSCFIGHYLGGYTKSRTYDRYLHGFGAFSFALFIYCILDDYIRTGGSELFRAIFVFLLGNTLGVIFELVEFMHDIKKKQEPKSQKGLQDTDMDMLFNLLGSALAGIFAYFLIL